MKKFLQPLIYSLISLIGIFFVQCQTNLNKIEPTLKNTMTGESFQSSDSPMANVVIGPYTVTFNGVTYSGTTSTWSYTIQRTGPAQQNGLSHWIIGLGKCANFSNVTGATLDGQPYTDLKNSEGSGTGCVTSGSFLKFDGLPSGVSDGNPHIFTFTLNVAVDVASNPNWVKAGPNCYQGVIEGPGCYHINGKVEKEECINNTIVVSPYAGVTVNLSNGASTTTDANGNYSFEDVEGGTYTVSVGSQSKEVTLGPGSAEGVNFLFKYEGTCGVTVCSFSQGYWFAKPNLTWGGTVTIGGKTYTQAEGRAIWNTSNAGGMRDAKKAFLQLAAIKLSGIDPSTVPALAADAALIEAYFASIPKLTPTTIPANSKTTKPVGDAGGRIGNWIDANHCGE